MNINKITRPNICDLKPYSSARNLNQENDAIFLDANENPFAKHGRYPDPNQSNLRNELSNYYGISPDCILPGNGSDELIDLLFRAFAEPRESNIIITDPTYGMYEVAANIQDCNVKRVLLNDDFSLNEDKILDEMDENTRIVFICTPNNPTGNEFSSTSIEKILISFKGIVVLDQAYADFSTGIKWRTRLNEFPNLAVLQTLSKAWGMAALRTGILFTNPEIIRVLMCIKLPYNLNSLTQDAITHALKNNQQVKKWINIIKDERLKLIERFTLINCVKKIFSTDSNFVLVRFSNAGFVFEELKRRGIIVRNRSNQTLCENTLRISVGTPLENETLISALTEIDQMPGLKFNKTPKP